MKNIQKLLSAINEKYYSTVDTVWSTVSGQKYTVDVYKNSDSSEILKLLKQSTKFSSEYALRFFMNPAGDYLLWNASDATHSDILEGRSAQSFKDFNEDDLRGQVFNTGIHIYQDSIEYFYPYDKEEQIEKFKQTRFYQALQKVGLGEIEIGMWL